MTQSAADRALNDALKVMTADPARAEAIARAVAQTDPAHGDAKLVLSEALRRQGRLSEAHTLVAPLAASGPLWFGAHRQLGAILADRREPLAASLAFRKAAEIFPDHPTIWRDVADQLALAGDTDGASDAYLRHANTPTDEPRLMQARKSLAAGDIASARGLLEQHLAQHPSDTAALRLASEAFARADRPDLAESSLRRLKALAPGLLHARHALAQLLMGLGRLEEADAEARALLLLDPANRGSRRLMGAIRNARGDYDEAAAIYGALLKEDPARPATWATYGHVLKTIGRTEESISAYREAITRAPQMGEAYWSLANLKTVRFSDDDVTRMRAQLAGAGLTREDRVAMLYALGKALEQRGDVEGAFQSYAEGASSQRALAPHDATAVTAFVNDSIALCDAGFFPARGDGESAPDPIFIIGLPRSGSTLVEQILASHSAVEGTMELPDLPAITRDLAGPGGGSYLRAMAALDAPARAELGRRYLRTTRPHRKLGRTFFIDKMPNNWMHVPLIQLILPNARIIDARRHPLACGWSCFKQLFALGQNFSYDLADIGRYYSDYVRLMAHIDAVLPGRVHRVIHEQLVTDPEPHIRALLAHCGLPFEPACLSPHETQRAVHTASAEQVRQPISAKGLDEWRPYEAHLGRLKQALGPVLDAYPHAP